jgi:uncharacterized protein YbjT (DUF2867 family)
MRAILFGATGMIGQGLLRELLLDAGVEAVLAVGRHASGRHHAKLAELVRADLFDLAADAAALRGYDACFFVLGVSSYGVDEPTYRRVTYELTTTVARTLLALNPSLVFLYVSGAGTDARSRTMWACVKGETENELLRLCPRAYMFRPGIIEPRDGVTSRTPLYRCFYQLGRPLFPLLRLLAPRAVTDTRRLARAMIRVARDGAPKPVLETRDIAAL